MKKEQTASALARGGMRDVSQAERRAYPRVGFPATGFAMDLQGKELGRIAEISGGGMRLEPASPWALISLQVGNPLILTVVEPGSENRTEIKAQVSRIHGNSIGLAFI